MPEIARQWFVAGDGIERQVISADIQRYLGNDATVRPGTHENQSGYWIRAYRTLTSAMIVDLQNDSARWRQEQSVTNRRDYAGSSTQSASAGDRPALDPRSSPSMDVAGYAPSRDEAIRAGRIPQERSHPTAPVAQAGRGHYAAPVDPRTDPRYAQDVRQYGQPDRYNVPVDPRSAYQADPQMAGAYGARPPVSAPYSGVPGYATSGYAPQGYGGNYGAAPDPYSAPRPNDPYAAAYGQPQVPTGRSARDARDPRDLGYSQDYADPRYAAYPSPAATVSAVAREPLTSPPAQQPSYPNAPAPQYDQYGRPVNQYGSDDAYGRPASDDGRTRHRDRRTRH